MARLAVAVLVLTVFLAAPAIAAESIEITCGPYLQAPTETSMTVMWLTDRDSVSWVEYGMGSSLDQRAVSSRDGLVDAGVRIHKIRLTGLEPGTEYSYRVYSKDIVDFEAYKVTFGETVSSDIHHFRTFDRGQGSYAFLAFTDIHEHLDMVPQLLAVNGDRPYDFVLFLGDIISHIDTEQQIVDFIRTTVEHFSSEVPFIWVRGNHETRGRFARQLARYIDSPNRHYYFSFDHGPAHFTVLDTGEDKADSTEVYAGLVDFDSYRQEQADWLACEIERGTFERAAFRIGLTHMPFPKEADAKWHGMKDAFQRFGPFFTRGKVDVLFAGHQHRYGIHDPVDGRFNYPIVQGAAWREGERTLIRVEVSSNRLDVEILGEKGEVVASRGIEAR